MKILHETPWYGYVLISLSFAAGAVLVLFAFRADERADTNETARLALCAQRERLDRQIERTREILLENPSGPVFGIPRKLIVDGLADDLLFRKDLAILDC